MRFIFFLLLKLIEIVAALVVVVGLMNHLAFLFWIFVCGGLLAALSFMVWLNWQTAGDWAKAWRKRKLDKKLARGRPPKH